MKYAIIANPVSGKLSPNRKYKLLKDLAALLGHGCSINGLETKSREDYIECAKSLENKADVLIIASGDGGLSSIINSVSKDKKLAYIPLGSGNSIRYALKLPRTLKGITNGILSGHEHYLNLIGCNGYKAFTYSLGIDTLILSKREELRKQGYNGITCYAYALFHVMKESCEKRNNAEMFLDGQFINDKEFLSLVVSKHPYYGYNIKINPNACLEDKFLHVKILNPKKEELLLTILQLLAKNIKNGEHIKAHTLLVLPNKEISLQADGDILLSGTEFKFEVLPKSLKMIY